MHHAPQSPSPPISQTQLELPLNQALQLTISPVIPPTPPSPPPHLTIMPHPQLANQANIDFEKPNHLHRDFGQIENKNKTAIKNQLESIDSNRVLRLTSSDLSS